MTLLASLLAPLALMLPMARDDVAREAEWRAAVTPEGPPMAMVTGSVRPGQVADWSDMLADDGWDQVRIEQRLIIRIAPRGPGRQVIAPPPLQLAPPRFRERKTANCLTVASIAGVQYEPERLVLYTRDRRMIGASLDKACSSRDFYSGFYIEQTADGLLCAGRDTIHSRAGTTCAISRLRELVPEN